MKMLRALKTYGPVIVLLVGAAIRAVTPPSTTVTAAIFFALGISVALHIQEERRYLHAIRGRVTGRNGKQP